MTALISHSPRTLSLTMSTGTASNLANARSLQVPAPFAVITPATGSFTVRGTTTAAPVRVLAFIASTLPEGSSVEFQLLNGGVSVFDEAAFALADVEAERNGARYFWNGQTVLLVLPSDINADEARFVATNAGTEVRVGNIWVAPAYVTDGINAGWTMQHEDFSLINRVGATPWPNQRARIRNLAATISPLTEAQAIGEDGIQPLLQNLGRSAPVLFVPSDTKLRTAIYGMLSAPGSVSHIEAEWYRAEIDVAEIGG